MTNGNAPFRRLRVHVPACMSCWQMCHCRQTWTRAVRTSAGVMLCLQWAHWLRLYWHQAAVACSHAAAQRWLAERLPSPEHCSPQLYSHSASQTAGLKTKPEEIAGSTRYIAWGKVIVCKSMVVSTAHPPVRTCCTPGRSCIELLGCEHELCRTEVESLSSSLPVAANFCAARST